MKSVLITGSSGLIGSACVEKFLQKGWFVYGIDNHARGELLGKEGDTKPNLKAFKESTNFKFIEADIRNTELMSVYIKKANAIVHCAAQPSHPRSLEIPVEDFQINAYGTLSLLELARKYNAKVPFAFMSSNKVYGDYPNFYNYLIVENNRFRRYENSLVDSFDESLPINGSGHTPFGVSKVAADLYCQEYAINYGMKTATFRGGCLIGSNQKAVEMHGFLGFFTKQIILGKQLKIFGGGYRVRDNIHSADVAEILYMWIDEPRPNHLGKYGNYYNIGGMRRNSVSIFETIKAIEEKTGLAAKYEESAPRESDHIWWITNMSKFKKDYPGWKGPAKDLDYIFNELIQNWTEMYKLKVRLKNKDYFAKLAECS